MASALLKCCVCDNLSTDEDPIIGCTDCDINVHVCCYGIEDVCGWKCSTCLDGLTTNDIFCVLCLQNKNIMKKSFFIKLNVNDGCM